MGNDKKPIKHFSVLWVCVLIVRKNNPSIVFLRAGKASLFPAGYLVDQGQKFSGLVGDGVLADVDATLLQRMLNEGGNRFSVH